MKKRFTRVSPLSNVYLSNRSPTPTVKVSAPTPITIPTSATSCLTSTQVWKYKSFSAKSGIFTAEFDAKPGGNYIDALAGLSYGTSNMYNNVAAFVRFKSSGIIDARNGSGFQAQNSIPYVGGATYLTSGW